jgi:CheY-like chemotaxis protein
MGFSIRVSLALKELRSENQLPFQVPMQSSLFPSASSSSPSRSHSNRQKQFHSLPCTDSERTLTAPDLATREDELGLLKPPLPLVILSNDTQFCSLTRAFLRHAGFSVFTCTTSDRAESLFLGRTDIQLWIIDVQALGIEAVYFATRVREQHPSMPVVLILGEHRDKNSLRHFLLHSWVQLTKPVDLSTLLTTINDRLTNVCAGSNPKNRPLPADPFEDDWLDLLQSRDFSRMRN